MPKELIDYSNTIIYKIYCKNINVTDVYVGHTTNFTKRKYQHKISSNNIKNEEKIYKVIRDNGGWDNWDMIEIAKYNCKDATEARIKEHEHYKLLNTSLNSNPPYVDKTEKFCSTCNVQCCTRQQFENHMKSNKHNKNISDEQTNYKFYCEKCNFACNIKSDMTRHLLRKKHLHNIYEYNQKQNINKIYTCDCGKKYKASSGLWKHQQKCAKNETNKPDIDKNIHENIIINDEESLSNIELTYMVLDIFKKNNELQKQNIDLHKQMIEILQHIHHTI